MKLFINVLIKNTIYTIFAKSHFKFDRQIAALYLYFIIIKKTNIYKCLE